MIDKQVEKPGRDLKGQYLWLDIINPSNDISKSIEFINIFHIFCGKTHLPRPVEEVL